MSTFQLYYGYNAAHSVTLHSPSHNEHYKLSELFALCCIPSVLFIQIYKWENSSLRSNPRAKTFSQYESPAQLLYQSKSVRPAASLFNHSTYSHDALLNGTSPNDQKTRKRRKKSQRMRRCLAVCVCKWQKQGKQCCRLSDAVRRFLCLYN